MKTKGLGRTKAVRCLGEETTKRTEHNVCMSIATAKYFAKYLKYVDSLKCQEAPMKAKLDAAILQTLEDIGAAATSEKIVRQLRHSWNAGMIKDRLAEMVKAKTIHIIYMKY